MDLKNVGSSVFVSGYVLYTAESISYIITGLIIALPAVGRVRNIGYESLGYSIIGILYFFFKDVYIVGFVLLFLFRFCVTSVYTTLYTYSTEIYPTCIRSKGLGINSFFARITTILIPVIIEH